MQGPWKYVVACWAVGSLLGLAGCGSGDKGDSQATAASVAGGTGGEAAGTDATGAGPAMIPPSAGPQGTGDATASREPVQPVVLIETSMGSITLELDPKKAPATVENFLGYVESGYYNGTIFHQVWKDAVILGGSFTPELAERPAGPPIVNEADNELKNVRGTIAMARQDNAINSATSQFFINVKDNPNYDHQPGAQETLSFEDYGYCVFGRVTEDSMPVVDRIAEVEVQDTAEMERLPVQTVLVKSMRRIR